MGFIVGDVIGNGLNSYVYKGYCNESAVKFREEDGEYIPEVIPPNQRKFAVKFYTESELNENDEGMDLVWITTSKYC